MLHKINSKKKVINKLNLLNKNKFKLILLQSKQNGYVYYNQIISFFKFIVKFKYFKKKLYFRAYPFLPLTKKPSEVRMGKGKGKINDYCKPIYKGNIIAEVRLSKKLKKKSPFYLYCKNLLKISSKKFNLKTKIISQDF